MCAWTLFVFGYTCFLQHAPRFHAGTDELVPCAFTAIDLDPRRRARIDGVVEEIAAACHDRQKATAYSRPAALRTIEETTLDTFAAEMSTRSEGKASPQRLRHKSLSRIVLKVWELAQQLPNENLSLEDLCAATGVSARQVQDAFVEMTGIRPTAFLRAQRLQRAKRMLLSGEAESVKAAAYTCRFPDLGRFSAFYPVHFR